jgi:hypothetical protein
MMFLTLFVAVALGWVVADRCGPDARDGARAQSAGCGGDPASARPAARPGRARRRLIPGAEDRLRRLSRPGLMVGQAQLMKLAPKHCDVMVRRVQDYAGKPAVWRRTVEPWTPSEEQLLEAQVRV